MLTVHKEGPILVVNCSCGFKAGAPTRGLLRLLLTVHKKYCKARPSGVLTAAV